MHILTAILLQAAFPGSEERFPLMGDWFFQQERQERQEPVQRDFLGVEAFVLWTQFDEGLRIEDHMGVGADLVFGWNYGKFNQGFSAGYAAWNTENDDSVLSSSSVRVRQYRLGYNILFQTRVVEFGLGITTGVYRYARRNENDTSPYVEFEGSIGFRPMPTLKIGFLGLASHTQSSFNRSHTHLFHNYSVGPVVEFRF